MGAGDMEGVAVWLRIGKAVKPGLVRLFQNMATTGRRRRALPGPREPRRRKSPKPALPR